MSAIEKYNQLAGQVTREIIAGLEKAEVFWQRTWVGGGMPRNLQSGRYYEGFNALYLNYITLEKKYSAPYFLTYRQARQLGGHVKKGEKGFLIVFWKIGYYPVGEKAQEGQPEAGLKRRFTPFIWTVFNIDQIEGVSLAQPVREDRTDNEVIQACEEVVARMPGRPRILHGGHQAFYDEGGDYVQLPERNCFLSSPAYYSTLFHELIHSTGHPSRLNRGAGNKTGRFGDEAYSKEELIAEIGASFLNAHTGIKNEVFDNSLAYLKSWMKALSNDRTMILAASSKAAAACRYILGLEAEAQVQEEEAITAESYQAAA